MADELSPPANIAKVDDGDDDNVSDSEVSEFSYNVKTKYFMYGVRRYRNCHMVDQDEYRRIYKRCLHQFESSEGFDVNWDEFEFLFVCRSVERSPDIATGQSNEELIRDMTLHAIEKHNKESGENLVFVEHVKANFFSAKGHVFFITFWARDLSSPHAESKLYQTKVQRFARKFYVEIFRQRPTTDEGCGISVT